MSSNSIYIPESLSLKFKPTYLMIKEHEITGLQYLCKTVSKNPIRYLGSGKYWKPHIKKHGIEHVKTIWYELYTDINLLVSDALALSENFDIVNSDRWANLKPENGLDGGDSEFATINNNKLVKENRHPWQNKNGDSLGKRNNIERVDNGTHPFLKKSNGTSVSSENHKNRSIEDKNKIEIKKINTCIDKYNSRYPMQNEYIATLCGLQKHNKSLIRFGVTSDEELYNKILEIAEKHNLYNKNKEPNLTKISKDHFSFYGKGAYPFLWKCYNLLKSS